MFGESDYLLLFILPRPSQAKLPLSEGLRVKTVSRKLTWAFVEIVLK